MILFLLASSPGDLFPDSLEDLGIEANPNNSLFPGHPGCASPVPGPRHTSSLALKTAVPPLQVTCPLPSKQKVDQTSPGWGRQMLTQQTWSH